MRTLVWNADDVIAVYASLFHQGKPYHFMEMPRDQRGFMWADQVTRNGKLVGVATSRGYSYYFRQMISLCTIDVDCSEPGTEVLFSGAIRGTGRRSCHRAPAPYKQDNRRVDLRTLDR